MKLLTEIQKFRVQRDPENRPKKKKMKELLETVRKNKIKEKKNSLTAMSHLEWLCRLKKRKCRNVTKHFVKDFLEREKKREDRKARGKGKGKSRMREKGKG